MTSKIILTKKTNVTQKKDDDEVDTGSRGETIDSLLGTGAEKEQEEPGLGASDTQEKEGGEKEREGEEGDVDGEEEDGTSKKRKLDEPESVDDGARVTDTGETQTRAKKTRLTGPSDMDDLEPYDEEGNDTGTLDSSFVGTNDDNIDDNASVTSRGSRSTPRFKPSVQSAKDRQKKKQEEEKQKKLLEKIKKKPAPKKHANVEDSYEMINPEEVGNFTLSQLIKRRVQGDTMKATLEREQQQAQLQQSLKTHMIQQTQREAMERAAMEQGEGTQMEFVDGKLVVKQANLNQDHSAYYPVVYEGQNHVTNLSFSKYAKAKKWTREETEEFYSLLRKYGTDFSTIESMMVGRTRGQIRQKFKKEEKENPDVIQEILDNPEDIDVEEFTKVHDEVQVKKRELDKLKEKNKMMGSLDPNATEADLNAISEEIQRSERSNLLNSLKTGTSGAAQTQDTQIDLDKYNQMQQQIDYENFDYENNNYYEDYGMDY